MSAAPEPTVEEPPLPFPDLVQPATPRGSDLHQRFTAFHAANPWVADELERMAAELLDAGAQRIGIGMLFEVLRWQRLRTTGDPYRLNNSYRSRYARLLLARRPEWDGLLEVRELRT